MKKKNNLKFIIFPLAIPFILFAVFYSKMDINPTSAGFWLTIVMGMSIGVALCKLFKKNQ